jgi:hypothetical protein
MTPADRGSPATAAAFPGVVPRRGVLRAVLVGPAIAAVAMLGAWAATAHVGLPLRDPNHVTESRLVFALGALALGAAVDLTVRVARGAGLRAVLRERWTRGRTAGALVAVLSFYATYLAYRNVKSVVPLVRPGVSYDARLGDVDRWLLGGRQPGEVLHAVLGTGAAAEVLSAAYMAFFLMIPVVLALALVIPDDARTGQFLAAALGLNWVLAALTYLLLPSLGPFHDHPGAFAALPDTAVRHMQDALSSERATFLQDPSAPGAAQSIGAFASLHVAIWCTVALAAVRLQWPRVVRALLWTGTVLTVLATVYFGWHYLADDVAGVLIALVALACARALTGSTPEEAT